MRRYLIFPNLAALNVVNDQLNEAFGYPTENTLTYCDGGFQHPTNSQRAMGISDAAFEFLTAEQQAAVITELPSDWISPPMFDYGVGP